MKIIKTLLTLLGLVVVGAGLFGWWRTYKSERSPNQETFRGGSADAAELDGDFQGLVTGYAGSWQGKTFNRAEQSGLNRFKEGEAMVTKYPFKTYVGKGLRDRDLDVIKLDYNQPGNPWWLKYIVDEIVAIGPNKYLGKVHIRLVSRVAFTMGYFTLEKK